MVKLNVSEVDMTDVSVLEVAIIFLFCLISASIFKCR